MVTITRKKKKTKNLSELREEKKEERLIRAWSFESAGFGAIRKVDYFIQGDRVINTEKHTEDVKEIVLAKIRREMLDGSITY
tara:strand:+ start:147 stop:392 length:246 start_codon:yes stop_codon:yes gene_type:complete